MTHLQQIQQIAGEMEQGEILEAIKYMASLIETGMEADYPWETPEFFAELDRRREAVRSGKVRAIPADEAFEILYSQLNNPS